MSIVIMSCKKMQAQTLNVRNLRSFESFQKKQQKRTWLCVCGVKLNKFSERKTWTWQRQQHMHTIKSSRLVSIACNSHNNNSSRINGNLMIFNIWTHSIISHYIPCSLAATAHGNGSGKFFSRARMLWAVKVVPVISSSFLSRLVCFINWLCVSISKEVLKEGVGDGESFLSFSILMSF